MDGEDGLGEAGSDAGDRLEDLEDGALVVRGEAEEGERVLADDEGGRESGDLAGAERGKGVGGALDSEADTAYLDDCGLGGDRGDTAADARDHSAAFICASCSRRCMPPRQT